jgi:signal transduction histidine kinase/GAF domain-containing protein
MTDESQLTQAETASPSPWLDGPSRLVVDTVGKLDTTLTTIVAGIAREMNAFGCVLWEVNRVGDPEVEPATGFLNTVAASWASGELFALDDVQLEGSPAAAVALGQFGGKRVANIQINGGSAKNDPFWKRHEVQGMCAVPVRFLDGNQGALTVYRQGCQARFSSEDEVRLHALAALVPGLVRAVRERIGLRLITSVEALIREAEGARRVGGDSFKAAGIRTVLAKVCAEVATAFNCLEASLYLEDAGTAPGKYQLMATNLPDGDHRPFYKLPADKGRLTGWVLQHREPVLIRDLAKFDRDWEIIRGRYPGLSAKNRGWGDCNAARSQLGLGPADQLPPLSYMAVPVFTGEEWLGGTGLRGAIRCRAARAGPYYFSERESKILGLVAVQVGQLWARWHAREELERENKAWNVLVKGLGRLNTFVHEEFIKPNPDETAVFGAALKLAAKVIPGAIFNDVRMHDAATNELYFVKFSASTERELRRLNSTAATRRFPATPSGKKKHLGVRVYLSGRLWSGTDVHLNNIKGYSPIFRNVRHMIIAPIGVEGQQFGVLDLRWTDRPIPVFAEVAATLLGRQLGIYHQMALLVNNERQAVARTSRAVDEAVSLRRAEVQATEDFSHQLRTPIAEVQMRIDLALGQCRDESETRTLRVLRGLFRRSERVAFSMRLLSELSHGRPLTLRRQNLDSDNLVKKLIELAEDVQTANTAKRINFTVERSSIRPGVIHAILADAALLEQMVSNLLDNAGKYSFRQSQVRIYAGLTHGTGRPFLAVTNKGLPFRAGEIERCKQRGWRSPDAQLIVTEGRGIGLWLVNEIMKAHGGELQIIPANQHQETEVRLLFPYQPTPPEP